MPALRAHCSGVPSDLPGPAWRSCNGDLLEKSVQAEHFRFVRDGRRVKSVYSFDKGENFRADNLFKDAEMKAA
jgi:hypothetical protein